MASVKSIIAGEQIQTIFKDTGKLAEDRGRHDQHRAQRHHPDTNDTTSYDNGVKVVPT